MADGKFTGFAPGVARSLSVAAPLVSYDGHRPPPANSDAPTGDTHPLLGSRGSR
jgi:hypothetical protein